MVDRKVCSVCKKPFLKSKFKIKCIKCENWVQEDCAGLNSSEFEASKPSFVGKCCTADNLTSNLTFTGMPSDANGDFQATVLKELKLINSRLTEIGPIKSALDDVKKKTDEFCVRLERLDGKVTTCRDTLNTHGTTTRKLEQDFAKQAEDSARMKEDLEVKIDDLEAYGRRSNLEIHGLQTRDGEGTKAIVFKLAELASLTPALTRDDIVAAHRVGHFKTEFPPCIIVKFASKDRRNQFYSEVRKIDSLTSKK